MLAAFTDQVDALEYEGRALAATAGRDLHAPVPSCPGWTMTDLVVHVGTFHGWVAGLLRDRAVQPRRPPPQRLPAGAEPVEWYEASLAGLLDTFRAIDPATPGWTVTTNQRAGAWALRQASETAVHSWDARNALGAPSPITHAASYLTEWLGTAIPYLTPFLGLTPPQRPLGIRPTDTPDRWLLATDGDTVALHQGGTGHAVVTGTASDVLLTLGGRPSDAVVSGDRATFEDWRIVLGAAPAL